MRFSAALTQLKHFQPLNASRVCSMQSVMEQRISWYLAPEIKIKGMGSGDLGSQYCGLPQPVE